MANAAMHRKNKDDGINLYTTPEWATQVLIDAGELDGYKYFWEPCCGMGHMSQVIEQAIAERWKPGVTLQSTDLFDHNYGTTGIDFLAYTDAEVDCIVTNPPFDKAGTHFKMLKHALAMKSVKKVCFFMPVQFLETKERAEWLEECMYFDAMYSFADRVKCLTGGDEALSKDNTAKHYAWFIFDKRRESLSAPASIKFLYKPDELRRKSPKKGTNK